MALGDGLQAIIEPNGRKRYSLRYRERDAVGSIMPMKRMSIGSFPEMTPGEARRKAMAIKSAIATGKSPAAMADARRANVTLAQAYEIYARENAARRPSTVSKDNDIWRAHIAPRLATTRIGHITRQTLADFVNEVTVAVQKRRIAKVTGIQGWRAGTLVLRVLRLMAERDQISAPPVDRLRRPRTVTVAARSRHLSADEMTAVWAAHSGAENGRGPLAAQRPGFRRLPILGLLVGCRLDELLSLEWPDLDLASPMATITIRQGNTEAARRIVPLSDPAAEIFRNILAERANSAPCLLVFPNDQGARWSRSAACNYFRLRWCPAVNINDLSSHDMRRSFIAIAAQSTVDCRALKAYVGHDLKSGDITARFGQAQPTMAELLTVAKTVAESVAGRSTPEALVERVKDALSAL
jgi:integrase